MGKKTWVFGALALAALTAAALVVPYDSGNITTPVPAVASAPSYADDFSQFVRECGTPNHEDSTLPDDDRNRTAPYFIKPYFITRDIDYDRAHLRIFLLLHTSRPTRLGQLVCSTTRPLVAFPCRRTSGGSSAISTWTTGTQWMRARRCSRWRIGRTQRN